MTDLDKFIEEAHRRARVRKLYFEYDQPYDHSRPFGKNNVGPYSWQMEFHNAGARYPERCLMAANKVGKTRAGAAEIAIHMLGDYPSWWKGYRFKHAIRVWTGAERTQDSKDIIQAELLGQPGEWGTGWIPRERLACAPKMQQAGVPEVVGEIHVKHKSGRTSVATLKTYREEARGWRGANIDLIWLDEEPKQEIYTEAQTRLVARKGILMFTVTPILGPSEVVRHFLDPPPGSGVYVKNVSWDDAPHLDPIEKERLLSSYPAFEREARTRGQPLLGMGAVFPIADDAIGIDPFTIPDHWFRINGVDFGMDHPAAGVFCAWDKDGGTFYIYDCYKAAGETPIYHADALKKHGDWIPAAWPHDGLQRDKGSGIALKDLYRKHGVYMTKEHAHYPDERGNSLTPGLTEMYEWMRTGRFKVFSTLSQWFEEKRLYHSKDDKVVQEHDDLMSATRYAFVMRRYAKVKPMMRQKQWSPSGPIVGGRRWLDGA